MTGIEWIPMGAKYNLLNDLANKCNGGFDGWDTPIVK
jgi:hypothetical protein